jgi:hypothetical protein
MSCADEQEWAVVARAADRWARERADAAALDRVLDGALARTQGEVPAAARLRWAWQVVRVQVPIVGHWLLASSLLVMMLGAAVALSSGHGWSRQVFVMLAPLAAAVGIGVIVRDGRDELALVMRAGPRLVLLARLTVVFTANLTTALLGSVAVAGRVHQGVGVLVSAWLGPMLMLVTIGLLVAVLSRPAVGISVALALWFLRVLAGLDTSGLLVRGWLAADIDAAWVTRPAVFGVAAALLVAAVAAGPRRLGVQS